jgi:hypothetical protein
VEGKKQKNKLSETRDRKRNYIKIQPMNGTKQKIGERRKINTLQIRNVGNSLQVFTS